MTVTRVTQQMMTNRSYVALQTGLGRLSRTQEQLSSGRVLNRPSDSPTDTSSAMRLRSSLAAQTRYSRNAQDGLAWLGQIDTTLTSMLSQVNRARDLGIQGVNTVTMGTQAREALAAEVDQLRESLISGANATYLGRPVFGGLVTGRTAYDSSGAYAGVPGVVTRTVAEGTKVEVNVQGPDVFGPPGADLFADLASLSAALRSGDVATVQTQLSNLDAAQSRITATLADVGTRYNRVDRADQAAQNAGLSLTTALSNVEDVDITKATMDLKMNEVAYQAALSATARLVQPSLAEFLR
jgi:flagellar hook-associated protein 3 FlgL